MAKREVRIESKKRKIEAFLELVKVEKVNQDIVKIPQKCAANSNCLSIDASVDYVKLENNNPPEPNGSTVPKSMAAEELAKLRQQLRARQKAAMQQPKLFLSVQPHNGFVDRYDTCPDGLFVFDVQHLILYALQGGVASYTPRWCTLLRHQKLSHVVVAVVEAVGAADLEKFADSFPFVSSAFSMKIQLKPPSFYGQTISSQLFFVPVSKRLLKRKQQEAGDSDLPSAKRLRRNLFSRLDLLMSYQQMIVDRFPLPQFSSIGLLPERKQNYVFTKKIYKHVSENSPLFAIDCEMCETTSGKELTRVAVMNEQRECIYTTLVKPHNTITNYLTSAYILAFLCEVHNAFALQPPCISGPVTLVLMGTEAIGLGLSYLDSRTFSGITRNMLKHVKTRLSDVQKKIQELLPADAILVGHSLNFDLDALQLMHPYIIDTSVIFNNSLNHSHKPGLKRLAAEVLHKVIQNHGAAGHDPSEDALAALDLVLHRLREESMDDKSLITSVPDLPSIVVESTPGPNNNTIELANTDLNKVDGDSVIESSSSSSSEASYRDVSHGTCVSYAIGNVSDESKETQRNVDNLKDKSVETRVTATADVVKPVCFVNPNAVGFPNAAIQNRNVFFGKTDLSAHDSLFDLLKINNKTAAVSGFECEELPVSLDESVTVIEADSDKRVIRACRQSAVRQHYLTFLRLSDIERSCSETPVEGASECASQQLQIMMSKLDKRIKKLSSSLEPSSLLLVLFGGGRRDLSESAQNAICFMKIT